MCITHYILIRLSIVAYHMVYKRLPTTTLFIDCSFLSNLINYYYKVCVVFISKKKQTFILLAGFYDFNIFYFLSNVCFVCLSAVLAMLYSVFQCCVRTWTYFTHTMMYLFMKYQFKELRSWIFFVCNLAKEKPVDILDDGNFINTQALTHTHTRIVWDVYFFYLDFKQGNHK